MEAAWRLAWALPLVLAVGAVAVLILRRFVVPGTLAAPRGPRATLRESLALSAHTRVHLVEVDGTTFLVIESAQQAALHSITHGAAPPRAAARSGPAWARGLLETVRR